MRPLLCALGVFASTCTLAATPLLDAQATPQRPAITGIAFVRFAVSDSDKARRFYEGELGLPGFPLDPASGVTGYAVNAQQRLETIQGDAAQTPAGPNRLLTIGLRTSSVGAMRDYLAAKGMAQPGVRGLLEPHQLTVHDPEGNTIVFTDLRRAVTAPRKHDNAISRRIIHAGFVVQSTDAENAFYRDILGFHPYWHGGFKEGVTDWYSVQVPDGTDWIEYMLNVKPDASAAQRGGSNHVSLGLEKMDTAIAQLKSNGCDTAECTSPKMGRDGKVQLNLYDPDHTRVEVMEFTPTGTTCCSPYTGRMPSANNPE